MAGFATTHWSLIRAASANDDAGRAALSDLCRIYDRPIRRYLSRYAVAGLSDDDLLQGFLLNLIESDLLGKALPERGTFRAYLVAAMRRYVSKRLEAQGARKRGGNAPLQESIEADRIADTSASPEDAFDRDWAETVLDRALDRLGDEARARGRGELFERLAPLLGDPADRGDYVALSAATGLKPNAIAAAMLRLRERYRELVQEEVRQTVSSTEELEEETETLRRRIVGD